MANVVQRQSFTEADPFFVVSLQQPQQQVSKVTRCLFWDAGKIDRLSDFRLVSAMQFERKHLSQIRGSS